MFKQELCQAETFPLVQKSSFRVNLTSILCDTSLMYEVMIMMCWSRIFAMRRLSLWMNLPTNDLNPTQVVSVSVVPATPESSPKVPKKVFPKPVDPAAPDRSQPIQERDQHASCSDPDNQPLERGQQDASCSLSSNFEMGPDLPGSVQDLYSYPSWSKWSTTQIRTILRYSLKSLSSKLSY